MDEDGLHRYATVLLDVGLGLSPGSRLLVQAPIHARALVHAVVRHAYRVGAVNVDVVWVDPELDRARLREGSDAAVGEVSGDVSVLLRAAEQADAVLRLLGDDAVPTAPIDPTRARTRSRADQHAKAPYVEAMMSGRLAWTLAAVPGPAWAAKVFPALAPDEALDALWSAVARACRIDNHDPVAAWREHLRQLDEICRRLDEAAFDRIRFVGPGTDLVVGLSPAHVWAHPGSAPWGCANVPTEEAPTAPHAARTHGTVRVRRPVVIDDTVVDGVELQFVGGAVVEASARQGERALRALLDTPGGDRLGEVSLVPQSSAVARERLVWHNILFDENDASHIALGSVIPPCIEGGPGLSPQQLRNVGANQSSVHVDLVVGASDVDAIGITEAGHETVLLHNGEWASPH